MNLKSAEVILDALIISVTGDLRLVDSKFIILLRWYRKVHWGVEGRWRANDSLCITCKLLVADDVMMINRIIDVLLLEKRAKFLLNSDGSVIFMDFKRRCDDVFVMYYIGWKRVYESF